eukprot:TRINITY_DN271_c0_g1_i2.p1 TRINITY_DN271_c0_g1~~TRINITY_DN271_c0_g1_i2.p1  ORF type:complete len:437 (+),score=16.97 TRINITY_DN271_c0_g1_i2:51-1313(+)
MHCSKKTKGLHGSALIDLPDELIIYCFMLVPPRELCRLGLVCRRFAMLCRDDSLWQMHAVKLLGVPEAEIMKPDCDSWQRHYQHVSAGPTVSTSANFSAPPGQEQLIVAMASLDNDVFILSMKGVEKYRYTGEGSWAFVNFKLAPNTSEPLTRRPFTSLIAINHKLVLRRASGGHLVLDSDLNSMFDSKALFSRMGEPLPDSVVPFGSDYMTYDEPNSVRLLRSDGTVRCSVRVDANVSQYFDATRDKIGVLLVPRWFWVQEAEFHTYDSNLNEVSLQSLQIPKWGENECMTLYVVGNEFVVLKWITRPAGVHFCVISPGRRKRTEVDVQGVAEGVLYEAFGPLLCVAVSSFGGASRTVRFHGFAATAELLWTVTHSLSATPEQMCMFADGRILVLLRTGMLDRPKPALYRNFCLLSHPR